MCLLLFCSLLVSPSLHPPPQTPHAELTREQRKQLDLFGPLADEEIEAVGYDAEMELEEEVEPEQTQPSLEQLYEPIVIAESLRSERDARIRDTGE